MKATKVIKKKKDNLKLNKQFMLSAAKVIAEKIVARKASSINGRVPWGFASNLLKQGQELHPKMSMRTINNYIKNLENGSLSGGTILVDKSCVTKMSSITNPPSLLYPPSPPAASTADDSTTTTAPSVDDHISILGGRPKGTTTANALDKETRIEKATKEAVAEFGKMKLKAKTTNGRLKKGSLTSIILACMQKNNLSSENTEINSKTVRQRLLRNTKSSINGPKSPLMDIEPYIVSLIIQLANMRVPLTTAQGLQLCNSIIRGTKYDKLVAEFKENNLRSATKELGRGYWRGFLKRNKNLISAKKSSEV
jgi:hypothetical protein